MTHYRKLRLQKERTCLFRVMNILKWKGASQDRALLDGYKYEVTEESRSWWGAAVQDPTTGKVLLTQGELEDLVLNGDVFHSEPGKKEALTRLTGDGDLLRTLAVCNYMRFARTVVHYAQKTAELVRQRGYLASLTHNSA